MVMGDATTSVCGLGGFGVGGSLPPPIRVRKRTTRQKTFYLGIVAYYLLKFL